MKIDKYMDNLAGYTNFFINTLKVISEQMLIWLKMILNWLGMNKNQNLSLLNYHQVVTI